MVTVTAWSFSRLEDALVSDFRAREKNVKTIE
jgi:hypothetical protein